MRADRRVAAVAAAGALALVALAGCGGGKGPGKAGDSSSANGSTVQSSRVEVIKQLGGGRFDPATIYAREASGVVTVISVLPGGASSLLSPGGGGGAQAAEGSGFVISKSGEIATNAHVVTTGSGGNLRQATQVYVKFADGNQVPAKIVGADPNADVALLKVDPSGLTLSPLPLGQSNGLVVGSPVAAIGSPFGEPQSLSVGVISATDRTIQSLNAFGIAGAIQTDAAINHGNSGGPLVDGSGTVIGINSQIQSTGGGGEGVGFAVPIDTVRRSLDQLRAKGSVSYAYLGVSTVAMYPQLARKLGIKVDHGAFVQQVSAGGPAAQAGIKAGTGSVRFEIASYKTGGDVIASVNGRAIRRESDLSLAVQDLTPGQTVTLQVYRGAGSGHTVKVKLGSRPASAPKQG